MESESQISTAEFHISVLEAQQDKLADTINTVEQMQYDLERLHGMVLNTAVYEDHVRYHARTIEELEGELKEVKDALSEFDMCPYCGSDLRREEHGKH